ncbi:hypothetical protein CUMW_006250, partial [Citrus unshiu]
SRRVPPRHHKLSQRPLNLREFGSVLGLPRSLIVQSAVCQSRKR